MICPICKENEYETVLELINGIPLYYNICDSCGEFATLDLINKNKEIFNLFRKKEGLK